MSIFQRVKLNLDEEQTSKKFVEFNKYALSKIFNFEKSKKAKFELTLKDGFRVSTGESYEMGANSKYYNVSWILYCNSTNIFSMKDRNKKEIQLNIEIDMEQWNFIKDFILYSNDANEINKVQNAIVYEFFRLKKINTWTISFSLESDFDILNKKNSTKAAVGKAMDAKNYFCLFEYISPKLFYKLEHKDKKEDISLIIDCFNSDKAGFSFKTPLNVNPFLDEDFIRQKFYLKMLSALLVKQIGIEVEKEDLLDFDVFKKRVQEIRMIQKY